MAIKLSITDVNGTAVAHGARGESLVVGGVAKRLGCEVSREAVAVRDSGSDIAMFLAVGSAAGNVSDDVKGYADVVAASVGEDGLAWVFEQVIGRGGSW